MTTEIIVAGLFSLPIVALAVQLTFVTRADAPSSRALSLQHIMQLSFCVLFLILSASLFGAYLQADTIPVIHVAGWPAPFAISLVFDPLSRLMLVIFSLVILCIQLLSVTEPSTQKNKSHFYCGSWLLILAITGALTTYDIFNLYVWTEVMLVSAFILLASYENKPIKNLAHYALFNIIGTLFILMGIAFIYGLTGQLNTVAIAQAFPKIVQTSQDHVALAASMLFVVGLLIKGGIFPFYFWLPKNYPTTSACSTLMLSSLVTKVIMLVLLRLVWSWPLLQIPTVSALVIFLAGCTMFFGVMGAANEFRIRHILSFHIISQLGYMLLAISIPSVKAIIGLLYFLIHNLLVKTTLLMSASIAEQQQGSHWLTQMGSLRRACPILTWIFFLSAISLAGLPPFSGFWGKLFIFQAAWSTQHYLALSVAMLVSLLTLYSMMKIWRFAFCQAAEDTCQPTDTFKLTLIQLGALLPLLGFALCIGFLPNSILPSLEQVALSITDVQLLAQTMMHNTLGVNG